MKLAIVGTGMIAKEALIALKNIPQITVKAIFSRPTITGLANGKKLSEEFCIPTLYTDYGTMLRDADIDFVYIGNVNSAHFTFAKKALEANKNLIIEKPICTSFEEYQILTDISIKKGLYIFEALTFLHAPFFHTLQNRIKELGPIHSIQCNYSKYSSRYDRYLKNDIAPVFNPELKGGSLLDLNIYNINLVIALFGYPTLEIKYYPNKGHNGIDTSGTLIMRYESFVATCTAAKDSYSPCFDIIQGEKGYIKIYGSPDNLDSIEYHTNDGIHETVQIASNTHRMVDEFIDFEEIYRKKDKNRMNYFIDISSKVMRVIDAIK